MAPRRRTRLNRKTKATSKKPDPEREATARKRMTEPEFSALTINIESRSLATILGKHCKIRVATLMSSNPRSNARPTSWSPGTRLRPKDGAGSNSRLWCNSEVEKRPASNERFLDPKAAARRSVTRMMIWNVAVIYLLGAKNI